MKLCFNLTGNHCNEYPFLTIYYNKDNIYCDYICNQTVLTFDVDSSDIGIVTLSGIQKSNGLDGKWDTMLDNGGRIVKDKNLQINNISIDNIDMNKSWINCLPMHKENNKTMIKANTLNKTKWNNLFKQYWKIIKLKVFFIHMCRWVLQKESTSLIDKI